MGFNLKMVKLLSQARWDELEPIFKESFDGSDLPTKDQAFIVADIDEESGNILGFVVLEQLWRIGQVWSNGASPRPMFRFVENSIQHGSVIGIASDVRFETLFTKFSMRKIEGTVYRRDF